MAYDIIGDIHGHDAALERLLGKLGYRQKGSSWHHPERTAIFVGDFIDRGPGQLKTINIVRSMIDSGDARAVMGNHELNAIGWHTSDPHAPGEYLRSRNDKNREQHEAFLAHTHDNPELHQELIDWFLTLPLWLELPELRVVHACWHPESMDFLRPYLTSDLTLDLPLVEAASRKGSATHQAIETILKGPEVRLPDGRTFKQGDYFRSEARTRWWDAAAVTFRQSAIVDPETRRELPEDPIPAEVRPGYASDRPVFFGHYWMTGTPQPLGPQVACVDYSVGKKGPLVAYRWDGESALCAENFCAA